VCLGKATVGDCLSFPDRVLLRRGREADTAKGCSCVYRSSVPDLSYGFIVPPHRPYVDPYKIFSHHGTVWKQTVARVANASLECEISGVFAGSFPLAQARAKCRTPRQPITPTWSDCDRSCQVAQVTGNPACRSSVAR
jgi:hypothetical protein